MDRCIEVWMNGQMDGMDGGIDRWTEGLKEEGRVCGGLWKEDGPVWPGSDGGMTKR